MSLKIQKKSKQDDHTAEKVGKKRNIHKAVWIVPAAAVFVAGLLLAFLPRGVKGSQTNVATEYLYAQAERGDITSELVQSGVLEPADSYTVISLVCYIEISLFICNDIARRWG